ncbi:MAG TPA: methyltransferase [Casimicrobiaceae bacterium]|nr:methyltransferase [Casimicrobiaceae bacterium]
MTHSAVGPEATEVLAERLLHWLHGFRASCMITTAVKLGLLDHIDASALSVELLAARLRAHEPSLRRFLRALEALGIVESHANAVGLTPLGRLLIDSRAGVRDWAVLTGEEYLPAWSKLGYSVMTGEPSFRTVFGMDVWEHRRAHPELDASFNRAMAAQQARARRTVLSAYDFSSCRLAVDVGGGSGALMVHILQQYPDARGLVFDQPHVVERAHAALAAGGVLDRCRIAGGSFLDSVPAGGDAYILQHVLHDWNDADCVTILRRCCEAMAPSSALLVVENIVHEGAARTDPLAMLDLHMLVMFGGRERTLNEYRSLLRSAGLEIRRYVPSRPYGGIIVAGRDGAERASAVSKASG